jgi:hypothetical protein
MAVPNNTLANLRDRVNRLIELQGEDAPAAAFIFTSEDVFVWSEDGGEQLPVDREVTAQILNNIEDDYDYLYTEIFNCIDNELRDLGVIKG